MSSDGGRIQIDCPHIQTDTLRHTHRNGYLLDSELNLPLFIRPRNVFIILSCCIEHFWMQFLCRRSHIRLYVCLSGCGTNLLSGKVYLFILFLFLQFFKDCLIEFLTEFHSPSQFRQISFSFLYFLQLSSFCRFLRIFRRRESKIVLLSLILFLKNSF